jgi:hypothetical protein
MGRLHLGAVAVVAMVFAGSSVGAQTRRHDPSQYGSGSRSSAAFDNGYRQGLEEGRNDARRNRPYDYRDRSDYRRGDWGWDRRSGDRDGYRNEFRRGFEVGYRDGYGRRGRNSDGRYSSGSRYPGSYGYPGGYGGAGGYGGQALQYGFSDGYQKGLEDIRDRDRYDPTRHGWYRSGDRHYERRYGSKDLYRNEYRRGFLDGYDRAFRGAAYRY